MKVMSEHLVDSIDFDGVCTTVLRRTSLQARVAIIIVNWNGWADTIDCLDTLLLLDYKNYVIVVVDNDSMDGSVGNIMAWCDRPYRIGEAANIEGISRVSDKASPEAISYRNCGRDVLLNTCEDCRVFIIQSGSNLGFAGGCNVGANSLNVDEFDYFWFLNSDTAVKPTALSELVLGATNSRLGGMVGSSLLYYRQPTVVQAMGGADLTLPECVIRHRGEGRKRIDSIDAGLVSQLPLTYIVGASMLVPTSLIGTIGLMQDDYFLYYEEIDWAFRSRGRYSQIFASESIVFHKAGASSKDKVSEFSSRLLLRNKVIFFRRYLPHFLRRLYYQMIKELIRHSLKGRWRIAKILGDILNPKNVVFDEPASRVLKAS